MAHKLGRFAKVWLIFFMLASVLPATAIAKITITNCVIQEPVAGSNLTAAYFSIDYEVDAELAALTIPDPEALERVEIKALTRSVHIHRTQIVEGVASMVQVSSLQIDKPKTELKPGGYHLMLTKLEKRPRRGEEYEMRVIFRFDPEHRCLAKVKTIAEIQN